GSEVAFYPVAKILAQRSASEGVGASAQSRDKQGGGRDLGGAPVVERNRIAGPIHEHLFAGVMLLAQHHILRSAPAIVQLTETAIAAGVGLRLAGLFPEELQGQVLVRL